MDYLPHLPPPVYYTLAALVAVPVLPTLSFFTIQYLHTLSLPRQLPWAGLKNKRLFSRTRANAREFSAARNPINEGYTQHSKHGRPFILPSTAWADIALPPHLNAWLIAQPDNVLSTPAAQDELLMLDHFGHGPNLQANHDFGVITRDLTRQMGRLLPELLEEVKVVFEEEFAAEESGEEAIWKEVRMYEVLELAVRRGVNRIFLGKELARDESVMKRAYWAGLCFSLCGGMLRMLVPHSLRALLAPIIGLPFYYQRWRFTRLLLPTIKARMAALQRSPLDEKSGSKDGDKPNDALQWILSSAFNPSTKTFSMRAEDIAGKTLLLDFFALHTTTITLGTVLYDILLHDPSPSSTTLSNPSNASLQSQLRHEASTTLPLLTKATNPTTIVRQMTKLDSTLRETLRFNPMFGRGIQRTVVSPTGVTTPDGLFLPQGTHVCAVIAPMQRDSETSGIEDADQYRPLRYCTLHPCTTNGEADTTTKDDSTACPRQTSAVEISAHFLTFSLGKHACPGRFFAVQTIKTILAHLLLHYDFEVVILEGKEGVKWLEVGEVRLPPQKTEGRVRVRRRSGEHETGKMQEDEGVRAEQRDLRL